MDSETWSFRWDNGVAIWSRNGHDILDQEEDVLRHINTLTAENARLREAISEQIKRCRCRGTGKYELDCKYCGDSTFDHICECDEVDCKRCIHLRSALAPAAAKEGV